MGGFTYTTVNRATGDLITEAIVDGWETALGQASTASQAAVYTVAGLDPTGVADIGPAMQAAVDSLLAQDGDTGSLSVPRGTYNLNTTVFLDGGDTEASTVTIDWNGSTILLGPNLYTTTAHANTAHKWGFFVNTFRTAVSGTVVTCTDGTRATGASSGQLLGLVMENAFFDSQGSARGIAFFDRSPIVMRGVGYSGSCGVSGRDYTDTMEFDHCNLRGSGSLFYWQTGQGDGLVITTPKSDSNATFAKLTTCHGAVISGDVTARFEFERCTNILINGAHLEGQQGNRAMLVLVNSEVTVDTSAIYTLYAATATDPAAVLIQDTADTEMDSLLRVRDCTIVQFMNNGTGEHTPWLSIDSADDDTCVEVTGLRTRYASVALGGKWPETGQARITGPAGLLTELATSTARANLAAGAFTLRMGPSSAWRCETPIPHITAVSRAQSAAPSIVQTLTSTGVISGGSLVDGTTYAYAVAVIDALGNYSTASAESTVAATSNGTVLLRVAIAQAPATLVVWRKTATGVLTAPDRYAVIPCAAREVRLYDVGAYIGGQPWVTTSVPVPNTVAASNATADAIVVGATTNP